MKRFEINGSLEFYSTGTNSYLCLADLFKGRPSAWAGLSLRASGKPSTCRGPSALQQALRVFMDEGQL